MSKETPPKTMSADELKPDQTDQPNEGQQETIDSIGPQQSKWEKTIEEQEELIDEQSNTIKELRNEVLRRTAETNNLGKRLRRDAEVKQEYAITHFAREILDVGDVLSTGLANCGDKESEHFQGMSMTLEKFYDILKQHGITPLNSLNTPFDHSKHEALTSQETDAVEPGMVITVVQEGYQFKDRLLRAAKVIVSKKVSEDS